MRESAVSLKICGLQPGDDVSFAQNTAVTHVGFIFVPKSRRYIAPELAARFVEEVRDFVMPVGVFADSPVEEILDVLTESGIQIAQLHGQETPAMCRAIKLEGCEVWKAVPVATDASIAEVEAQIAPYLDSIDALLLDAKAPSAAQVSGGHGKSFDWSMLSQFARYQTGAIREDLPIWIAGGIESDNVDHLFNTYIPFGVDVSSGVEVHGRKSPERILEMIEAVKRHA